MPDKTGTNPGDTDSDVKLNGWEMWKCGSVVFHSSLQNTIPLFPSSKHVLLLLTKQSMARPSLIQKDLGSQPLNKVPEVFQRWWRALWRLSWSGVPNSQPPPTGRTISGEKFNKLSVAAPRLKTTHEKKSALICYELLVNISASSSRSSRGELHFLHLFAWVFFSMHYGRDVYCKPRMFEECQLDQVHFLKPFP